MSNKRKEKIVNVLNYSNRIKFGCNLCNYIARGKRGMSLHWKYTHKSSEKLLESPMSYCEECDIEIENVKKHMVRYHHLKK